MNRKPDITVSVHIGTTQPATPSQVEIMRLTPVGEDGRSEWLWIRLANGDLIYGCFPQGNTYEVIAQSEGMI